MTPTLNCHPEEAVLRAAKKARKDLCSSETSAEILRLRGQFAKRTAHSAHDDETNGPLGGKLLETGETPVVHKKTKDGQMPVLRKTRFVY